MKKIIFILCLVFLTTFTSFGCEEALKGKIIEDFQDFSTYLLFEEGDRDTALYVQRLTEWMEQKPLDFILPFIKEEFIFYYTILIKSDEWILYELCEDELK